MGTYRSFYWEPIVDKNRPSYPDYEEEVVLTIYNAKENKYKVTVGVRSKTDIDGHHWEFPMKDGTTKNWEVVAWAELEPYELDS